MDPITPRAPGLTGAVVLSQFWRDLVFVHWRVDASEVAPLLPPGIVPDEFDGSSWVGLIPFEMEQTRVFGRVPVGYFGTFTEVNVRLYGVDRHGRRGVVFSSLEASRLAAVLTARAAFSLPYQWARAASVRRGSDLAYRSHRLDGSGAMSRVRATTSTTPAVGELAEFLTARWTLFVERRGRTLIMPNEHDTWALFDADLVDLDESLLAAAGIRSVGRREPDSVLYSPGVRTLFGAPAAV
ncbi:YqjF family protein [Marisediminicola sp. LYQ134]|uniref:YqjF family protein n=1 Tax=Marisediminicola sp. LYQ134 TaxID=3391061 RepID=UPI003982F2C5